MDATLRSLGNLLVESIPTIVFFLFLYFFLRQVFFRPIAQVLEERRRATEGVRALSEQAFATADKKADDFQRALELARQEISAENEKMRQQWAVESADAVSAARARAEADFAAAQQQVKAEIDEADKHMEEEIEPLIQSVMQAALRRRAA